MRPWKPGQSGNPRGSSRKERARRTLRAAVRDALDQEVPEELRKRLREAFGAEIIGEAIADVIAARLVAMAMGGRDTTALSATAQLLAIEPASTTPEPEPQAPEIPEDTNRLREVARALREAGVLEDDDGCAGGRITGAAPKRHPGDL